MQILKRKLFEWLTGSVPASPTIAASQWQKNGNANNLVVVQSRNIQTECLNCSLDCIRIGSKSQYQQRNSSVVEQTDLSSKLRQAGKMQKQRQFFLHVHWVFLYHIFFIHSSVSRHQGQFYFLYIMNSALKHCLYDKLTQSPTKEKVYMNNLWQFYP